MQYMYIQNIDIYQYIRYIAIYIKRSPDPIEKKKNPKCQTIDRTEPKPRTCFCSFTKTVLLLIRFIVSNKTIRADQACSAGGWVPVTPYKMSQPIPGKILSPQPVM